MADRKRWFGAAERLAIGVLAAACGLARAQGGPRPPCGVEPVPAIPALENSPAVKFWSVAELGERWRPPPCTGWTGEGYATLVTTTARFRYGGGVEELLHRSGAISSLVGLKYWSTTHQEWQTLINEAYAVNGPNNPRGRGDFTLEELKPGAALYFQQADNLSGKAVFRLRILEATEGRLVFDVANVTPMRYLLISLFPVEGMQSIYYLEREEGDVWRYYAMTRTSRNASRLTKGHEASWINRAVAYYRHAVGIPADREPPAAR